MRVMCIDAKLAEEVNAMFILKEGEVYTVTDVFCKHRPDWVWYELSVQPQVGYAAERFVPLSDIDEMELVENNTEKYQLLNTWE